MAKHGFDAVPPEWLSVYLRWWGVYTQGDGLGVLCSLNASTAQPLPNAISGLSRSRRLARPDYHVEPGLDPANGQTGALGPGSSQHRDSAGMRRRSHQLTSRYE